MSDLVIWGLILLGIWLFRRRLMAMVRRLVPVAVLLLPWRYDRGARPVALYTQVDDLEEEELCR